MSGNAISDALLNDIRHMSLQHPAPISNMPGSTPTIHEMITQIRQHQSLLDVLIRRVDILESENAVMKEIIEEMENG